ncbi:MAG: flagellar biosynthetic protein FliO [Lachnospiraceae bacterium]|nr:flagellar biosynthetic protein FliO [Lachnospiraceae bacterium]
MSCQNMILLAVNRVESVAQFLTVTVIFLFVLGITFLTSKWIAGYQKGLQLSGNIHVVETSRIANGKYIQIVQVGTKYLAIAVCKDTVTTLCELTEEELLSEEQSGNDKNTLKASKTTGGSKSFQDILDKMKHTKNESHSESYEEISRANEEEKDS